MVWPAAVGRSNESVNGKEHRRFDKFRARTWSISSVVEMAEKVTSLLQDVLFTVYGGETKGAREVIHQTTVQALRVDDPTKRRSVWHRVAYDPINLEAPEDHPIWVTRMASRIPDGEFKALAWERMGVDEIEHRMDAFRLRGANRVAVVPPERLLDIGWPEE